MIGRGKHVASENPLTVGEVDALIREKRQWALKQLSAAARDDCPPNIRKVLHQNHAELMREVDELLDQRLRAAS